jgi:Family of unknown function (DUF6335)
MAKRKRRRSGAPARRKAVAKRAKKRSVVRAKSSAGKRPKAASPAKRARIARKTKAPKARLKRPRAAKAPAVPAKVPKLDRVRRTLNDDGVPTPPSSLNMERHGTAARSGRAEMEDNLRKHGGITPGITGGDVDANYENAYFSGDEAPGGDNPTPDQDVVDDIGKALGVEYNDNEELKSGDKVSERDKHRWELDPASSEDYKERE